MIYKRLPPRGGSCVAGGGACATLEKQLRYGERGTPSAATPSVAYGATSLRREALATFVAKVQPPSAFYTLRGAEDFARICNTTRLTGGFLLLLQEKHLSALLFKAIARKLRKADAQIACHRQNEQSRRWGGGENCAALCLQTWMNVI